MKYVMLDTSVLINCTLLNAADSDPELLVALFDRMRDQGAKLLVPEVVKLEYARKAGEELEFIKGQTKKFRGSVKSAGLPSTDVSRIHETLDKIDADRDKAARRAQSYFLQVAADPDISVPIPLDGNMVAEAIGYVLAGSKPSSGPGRGLLNPDSLIVASVARFARLNGLTDDDTILVCSSNHNDFAQYDANSKTHLLADSISDAICCNTCYYHTPRFLLEQEFEIVVEDNEALRDALADYDELVEVGQAAQIDPSILEAMRQAAQQAAQIDPYILKAMRQVAQQAAQIDPYILKAMRQAAQIDPSILEAMGQGSPVSPGLSGDTRNYSEPAENTKEEDEDISEARDREYRDKSNDPQDSRNSRLEA